MGKYGTRHTPEIPKINREVHPVMRGIGCIMIVVVPIVSYLAATIIINTVPLPFPPGMMRPIDIPAWMYNLNGMTTIFNYIESQPYLMATVIVTVIVAVFLFSIMFIVYGFIYKAFGPSQYGPLDEPPIRKKVKKYTR